MTDDIRLDQIHRYLLGEMEGEELAAFQQRLQADPELAADLALEEELQLLIQYERKRELKEMLRNAPEVLAETRDSSDAPGGPGGIIRPPWKRAIPWLAGLAAILVAAVFVYPLVSGGPGHQDLYDQHMPKNPKSAEVMRGGGGGVATKPKGYKEFDQGDYAQAYSLLDTTLADTTSLLLHGIAAMKLPQPNFNQAVRDFQRLENMGLEVDFALQAHWYHALVDLHEKRNDACKRHLDVLIQDGRFKKASASALKEDLAKLPSGTSR